MRCVCFSATAALIVSLAACGHRADHVRKPGPGPKLPRNAGVAVGIARPHPTEQANRKGILDARFTTRDSRGEYSRYRLYGVALAPHYVLSDAPITASDERVVLITVRTNPQSDAPNFVTEATVIVESSEPPSSFTVLKTRDALPVESVVIGRLPPDVDTQAYSFDTGPDRTFGVLPSVVLLDLDGPFPLLEIRDAHGVMIFNANDELIGFDLVPASTLELFFRLHRIPYTAAE